jgi:hypothetical protein
MNCHGFNNVQDLYWEDRLSPRRAAQVRAHLNSCADCRTLVKPVPAAPAVSAPEELKRRLMSALRAAAAAAPAGRDLKMPLWPREAPAIFLAAVALVLVAFLITATGVPSQQSGGAPIAAAEDK